MKFPYGLSHFEKIIAEGYYYCDRTDRIPAIENRGDCLLFIRPRRFGKSLLLSMLREYYDIAAMDRFDRLFGGLKIGKSPTPLRNRYFILQWDFSCVDPTGTREDIRRALYGHINSSVRSFIMKYEKFSLPDIVIFENDALASLRSLLDAVRNVGRPLYLLIDEYDNFANEVMMGLRDDREVYNALVHEKGPLKTLFKAVKSAAGEGLIDRIFITGVSPLVVSDITSGFNIAKNIYLDRAFNDLCGFSANEAREIIEAVTKTCGKKEQAKDAFDLMRTYYDGYTFAPGSEQKLFNPTLVLYFAEAFQRDCEYPRKMLDANLAMDEAKLVYVSEISRGRQMLLEIARKNEPVTVTDIADRFGIREMLADSGKDHDFLASFLYYFGVLTLQGEHPDGKLELRVPNLVMRGLYVNRIQRMLLPEPEERDAGKDAAERLYTKGEILAR